MLKSLLNRIRSAPPVPPTSAPATEAASTSTPAPAAPQGPRPEDVARADALVAEGNALEDGGQPERAERLYREAIEAAPDHPRGHLNLGIALAARGDIDGAIAAYERVLAIDPDHPFGNFNLARQAFVAGDHERARALLEAALRTKPEFPQALVLQASVLDALDRPDEAVEALKLALRLQPEESGAWFNLAALLHKLGRCDEGEAAVRRTLEHTTDQPGALVLLSWLLRDQGFANEALAPLQAVIAQYPTDWLKRSFELILMIFAEGVPVQDIVRRHLEFGADLEKAVPERFQHAADRGDPQRRLRVGYFSCDFKLHPIPFFLIPVLERHDRSRVEVFCYSFVEKPDGITERVKQLSDHWRDVTTMSDTEAADAIHADGIDVLVDLVGHTGLPRLGIFSQKPAPVQVSWIGYLGTTGMSRMDFRLCDRRTDPLELAQPLHSERLVHMPFSQWCYRPMVDEPVSVGPVERNGHVTFGSFNAPLKISTAMCRRWGEVLMRVPRSRLLITNVDSERKREAIVRDLASVGVEADRLEFLPRVALNKYPALFHEVDISLDTYPYGGGTTTFDALWMGVPVVTAVVDTPVSRSAGSILAALDLGDWIAQSIDDFVEVAVARASDLPRLAELRGTLRARMKASPLTDAARFTKDLESAYRQMWLAKGR
jgi:predicted O-linked N-acetylglucosamine transferase (SPINDLY family)